jgi:hypothetical protein
MYRFGFDKFYLPFSCQYNENEKCWDGSVGIVTGYGLEGLGSNPAPAKSSLP